MAIPRFGLRGFLCALRNDGLTANASEDIINVVCFLFHVARKVTSPETVNSIELNAFLLFISGPHNAEVELPLCRRFLVCDISKDQHGSWGNWIPLYLVPMLVVRVVKLEIGLHVLFNYRM